MVTQMPSLMMAGGRGTSGTGSGFLCTRAARGLCVGDRSEGHCVPSGPQSCCSVRTDEDYPEGMADSCQLARERGHRREAGHGAGPVALLAQEVADVAVDAKWSLCALALVSAGGPAWARARAKGTLAIHSREGRCPQDREGGQEGGLPQHADVIEQAASRH